MTTTPINPSILPGWVTTWTHLIASHEKLLIVILAGVLLFHFGEKGFNAYENHLKTQATITQQQTDQSAAQNKLLAQTLADMQVQYKLDMSRLDAKISASKQQVIVQQKTDAALPLPDLATRWESLLVLTPGSITPQSNGTLAVTTDAAHLTVTELDKVGPLTDQLIDTQQELKGCTDLSSQKDKNLTGIQEQLALEQKGRAEDKQIAKNEQRKSFWKGTKWGAGLTAVGVALLKIAVLVK